MPRGKNAPDVPVIPQKFLPTRTVKTEDVIKEIKAHWFFADAFLHNGLKPHREKYGRHSGGCIIAVPKRDATAWYFSSVFEWEKAKQCILDTFGPQEGE